MGARGNTYEADRRSPLKSRPWRVLTLDAEGNAIRTEYVRSNLAAVRLMSEWELKDAQPCCDFCGDAPQWVHKDWTICHRPRCALRADAGPAAATPWWEGAPSA